MCAYKKPNPDNSVKLKLPTGFPVINMKVFQLWKAKNNICWEILGNVLEKYQFQFPIN